MGGKPITYLEGSHYAGDIALVLGCEGDRSLRARLSLQLTREALSTRAKEVERIDLEKFVGRRLGDGQCMLGAIVVGQRP